MSSEEETQEIETAFTNIRKVYAVRRFVFSFDIRLSWIPNDGHFKSVSYRDKESGRQWSIRLRKQSHAVYVTLFVSFHMKSSHPKKPALVKCSFDIKRSDETTEATAEYLTVFMCKHAASTNEPCRFDSGEIRTQRCDFTADSLRKVIVTTEFESPKETTKDCENPMKRRHYEPLPTDAVSKKFTTDMVVFMKNKHFSDVLIQTDGVDIPAHKAILMTRSPVFAAMFRHDVLESSEGRVFIEDFSVEVIRQLVEFLYTGQQPDFTNDSAVELLKASEKYEVSDLKPICEKYLSEHLDSYDAVEMLVLADKFRASTLKQSAIDFVISNIESLIENEKFSDLPKDLLMEIMRKGMCS